MDTILAVEKKAVVVSPEQRQSDLLAQLAGQIKSLAAIELPTKIKVEGDTKAAKQHKAEIQKQIDNLHETLAVKRAEHNEVGREFLVLRQREKDMTAEGKDTKPLDKDYAEIIQKQKRAQDTIDLIEKEALPEKEAQLMQANEALRHSGQKDLDVCRDTYKKFEQLLTDIDDTVLKLWQGVCLDASKHNVPIVSARRDNIHKDVVMTEKLRKMRESRTAIKIGKLNLKG